MGRQALLALLCISAALALTHAQLDSYDVDIAARNHKHKEPKNAHNTEQWDEKIELTYELRSWRGEADVRFQLFCPSSAKTASALPSGGASVQQPNVRDPAGRGKTTRTSNDPADADDAQIAQVDALTHSELWQGGIQLLSTSCTERGTIVTQGFTDAHAAIEGGDYAITGGLSSYLGVSGFVRMSAIRDFDPRDRNDDGIYGHGTYTIYLIHHKNAHGKY